MIELGIARPETRASDYTDSIVSAVVAAASGNASTAATATAALEEAAGLWSRAFMMAEVQPAGPRTASLTPALLGELARDLCRRGEAVYALDVRGGRLALTRAWSWDVAGGPDPATWVYRAHVAGPTTTVTRRLDARGVCHVQYASDAARPWLGLGPLQVAVQAGRLAGHVEKALADEASGPRGTLVTAPEATGAADDGDDEVDPYAELRKDLAKLAGGLTLVESFAAGAGDRGLRPDRDWKPERLGADPPAALVELRKQVADAVLAACGVPPGLWMASASASMRESFRTFYRSTVLPVSRLVAAKLSEALEVEVRLAFPELGAADVATAARAYQSLIGAGMQDADARRIAGLP